MITGMPAAIHPRQVSAIGGPWPLHDSAATRALEAAAAAGSPLPTLMERAGLAVARLALAWAPNARRVLVLAGPGNNGGDGWVAARRLHQAGRAVHVWLVGDAQALPPDAAQAMHEAVAAGVPWRAFDATADWPHGPADIAVDALLGLGSRRAPEGALAAAITRCNALHCARLAVDLPSGLHPDTGALLGGEAVHADATLSLLTIKPGLFTAEGRDHAGDVWWHDLGAEIVDPVAWLAGPPAERPRAHAAHKGRFGDVAVVGGAVGMRGAAWLAGNAALAAGSGRVFVSLLESHGESPAARDARPELMRRQVWWRQPPAVLAAATVVCGCGGGAAVRHALPALLAHAGRLVLDADALNALASDTALRAQLAARGRRGAPTVLTPHPLEAARLLGCSGPAVQADRRAAADALADEFQSCVVLKGSGSWITAPGELPHLNPTGNAALATAGTGDVLAGWIGGCWSAERHGADGGRAAREAVWLHGRAADRHRARGLPGPLRALDLIEAMAETAAASPAA